jgi:hypothetical protein
VDIGPESEPIYVEPIEEPFTAPAVEPETPKVPVPVAP